jgi:hypothetical protein
MKRILIFGVLLALVMSTIGCAGSGNAPVISPDARTAIDLARGIGRSGIAMFLQSKGVPMADTAAALAILDSTVIDPALNRGTFNLAVDPATWAPVRAKLVSEGSKALTGLEVSGVAIVDQATAESLIGQLVDTIAAVAKRAASRPAGSATTSTPGSTR